MTKLLLFVALISLGSFQVKTGWKVVQVYTIPNPAYKSVWIQKGDSSLLVQYKVAGAKQPGKNEKVISYDARTSIVFDKAGAFEVIRITPYKP
jgi:hypothetical protein